MDDMSLEANNSMSATSRRVRSASRLTDRRLFSWVRHGGEQRMRAKSVTRKGGVLKTLHGGPLVNCRASLFLLTRGGGKKVPGSHPTQRHSGRRQLNTLSRSRTCLAAAFHMPVQVGGSRQ